MHDLDPHVKLELEWLKDHFKDIEIYLKKGDYDNAVILAYQYSVTVKACCDVQKAYLDRINCSERR